MRWCMDSVPYTSLLGRTFLSATSARPPRRYRPPPTAQALVQDDMHDELARLRDEAVKLRETAVELRGDVSRGAEALARERAEGRSKVEELRSANAELTEMVRKLSEELEQAHMSFTRWADERCHAERQAAEAAEAERTATRRQAFETRKAEAVAELADGVRRADGERRAALSPLMREVSPRRRAGL